LISLLYVTYDNFTLWYVFNDNTTEIDISLLSSGGSGRVRDVWEGGLGLKTCHNHKLVLSRMFTPLLCHVHISSLCVANIVACVSIYYGITGSLVQKRIGIFFKYGCWHGQIESTSVENEIYENKDRVNFLSFISPLNVCKYGVIALH